MDTLRQGQTGEKWRPARAYAQSRCRLTYLHKDDSAGAVAQMPTIRSRPAWRRRTMSSSRPSSAARDLVETCSQPGQGNYALSFIVDGVSYNQPALDRTAAESAVQAIKVIAAMAVEERRRPQTGRFKTRDAGGAPSRSGRCRLPEPRRASGCR